MELENMVREGTVTAVDNNRRIAKVWFDALEIPSDWLPVLITRDCIPDYDAPQGTESAGESGENAVLTPHTHGLTVQPYMPKIGDQVLVLYFPVVNGDGVILGGVQPWR